MRADRPAVQHQIIYERREIVSLLQQTGCITCFAIHDDRIRREFHQQPIHHEQANGDADLPVSIRPKINRDRNQITNRDALQHAGDAHGGKITVQPLAQSEFPQ
jgi:hypothetical protein